MGYTLNERCDVALLQLVSAEGLSMRSATLRTPESLHSRALIINRKLIDMAIARTATRLYVSISGNQTLSADREMLPDLYTDLWDACLEAQHLNLDCIVLTGDGLEGAEDRVMKTDSELGVVFNAGSRIDRFAVAEYQVDEKSSPTTESGSDSEYSSDASTTTVGAELLELNEQRRRSSFPSLRVHSFETDLYEEADGCDFVLYDNSKESINKYKSVVMGGTFDHFHNGHKKLLTVASQLVSERITIGVTSEAMLAAKSDKQFMESFEARDRHVKSFLNIIKPSVEVVTEQLQDAFGPSIRDPGLEAIIVSSETIKGARLVNERRKAAGLSVLDVIVIQRANVHILSSSFVRARQKQNSLTPGAVSSLL